MSSTEVVAGFSLVNRWLLYTSLMLAPAQFVSGLNSKLPVNLGFIAYNLYTQYQWYQGIRGDQLGALSMLPAHFNLIYAYTYLGGLSSGTLWLGIPLGLATGGVLILNTISAWASWAMDMPEGYGEYQFFFFGWRVLDGNWHTFFLLWQIFDSMNAFASVITAIYLGAASPFWTEDLPWWLTYAAVPAGSAAVLLVGWPLILWTELIVARNNIESETDMVAVWLFVGQVAAMLIPTIFPLIKGIKWLFQKS